jgi:arginyl-tRNA synthetase
LETEKDPAKLLAACVVAALWAVNRQELLPADAQIRPVNKKIGAETGGDFQSNLVLSLTNSESAALALAAQIVRCLTLDGIAQVKITGPGFITFTLENSWLEATLKNQLSDERLGVLAAAKSDLIVVDYSSPNVAKEMHVGHLRSTIIGDALVRILTFAGHTVIRRNHLGDWGTPFGMLLEYLVETGQTRPERLAIADLNSFYQTARQRFETNADFARRARARVVALQAGEPKTLALWRGLVAESQKHFAQVYQRLGVLLDENDIYGESFYNDRLAATVAELTRRGLTASSEGAICAFPPGFTNREGGPLPLILQKSDGGYGYATTDLAAITYWMRERRANELTYVVGSPQRQHFEMVLSIARAAGWLTANQAVYVEFGSVLGLDGKMLRTRSGGDSVKLSELLDEAEFRAAEVIAQHSRGVSGPSLAKIIGIGALKYADLSNDRTRDYTFSWERALAFEGNTAVYLQYAKARIKSLLARAEKDLGLHNLFGSDFIITSPAERELALKLLSFASVFDKLIATYRPHHLCTYLYELATLFSIFYEQCPVLNEPDKKVQRSRLALADLTAYTLTFGLSLLGIESPDHL